MTVRLADSVISNANNHLAKIPAQLVRSTGSNLLFCKRLGFKIITDSIAKQNQKKHVSDRNKSLFTIPTSISLYSSTVSQLFGNIRLSHLMHSTCQT
ncbi:hypothetical protein KSF78_0009555 [Schistosoma japonicum]|nr:hypothetical protein KSF78_0009555 [Schistosoma japonicum]